MNATELIPAGFEVAKEEFAFASNNYFVAAADHDGSISVEKENHRYNVNAGDLRYEFWTVAGRGLTNMRYKERNILNQAPRINFWRAPTDNDFGENMQNWGRIWDAASHTAEYKFINAEEKDGKFAINYEVAFKGIQIKVDLTYVVNGDGSLTTTAHYQALSEDLPEMVRFGMLMTLPREFGDFTWYGRGPHENYVDRNGDTFMGIWNGRVEDQAFHYYRPQETGNKTDVRWLELKNHNGVTIRVEGAQPLSVSATNNLPEDLDPGKTKKQQHWSDIIPRNDVVLCVDLFQRGVAGLQSWGAKPLDQYRFMEKEYTYTYTIKVSE